MARRVDWTILRGTAAVFVLSLAVLAGCGSDSNPINPTAAGVSQVSSVNSTVPRNVFSATLTGTEEAPIHGHQKLKKETTFAMRLIVCLMNA